jgi:[ribosomal protein S5]-alanine N-acetyltransferase
MENMPYQSHLDVPTSLPAPLTVLSSTVTTDWRKGLPTLTAGNVSLRELRAADAPALFAALTSDQVSRFISPPPATVEGFERFIAWTIRQRQNGQYVCFAVVTPDSDTAIGIFQVRSLEPAFGTAEWGFALASEFWGTGIFVEGSKLVIDFAFNVLGVHRLEARAALQNGRGNGALRKLGAVQEGVLRRSFARNGEYMDQALWTILRDEWLQAKTVWGSRVIH